MNQLWGRGLMDSVCLMCCLCAISVAGSRAFAAEPEWRVGLARVKITPSESRVAWLPITLVTASTLAPDWRARRIAASVSAVSPDWVMPITRSFSLKSGLR